MFHFPACHSARLELITFDEFFVQGIYIRMSLFISTEKKKLISL